jgi:prophage regulatory protein
MAHQQGHGVLAILRRKQVEARVGLSRSTIYARMAENPPSFPRPISIGRRAVGWLCHEIEEFLAAQVKRSRNAG